MMVVHQHIKYNITFKFKWKTESTIQSLRFLGDSWQCAVFLSCVELYLAFRKALFIFIFVFAHTFVNVFCTKDEACVLSGKMSRIQQQKEGERGEWWTGKQQEMWQEGKDGWGKTAKGQSRWIRCNIKRQLSSYGPQRPVSLQPVHTGGVGGSWCLNEYSIWWQYKQLEWKWFNWLFSSNNT